jgi:antagonist of KipI
MGGKKDKKGIIMGSVIISSAGMLTTVQDSGRYGYQRFGMPVSGAMDLFSYNLANMLVGNSGGEACLEATVTGPEIYFRGSTAIAVCGADMGPVKNGIPVGLNRTIIMKDGDVLGFTGLERGCRSYIAFAGGIDVPLVMGSRSTCLRAGTGGYRGRALRSGDELDLGVTGGIIARRTVPEHLLPPYGTEVTVRVCRGPEADRFDDGGRRTFFSSGYVVSDQSDRMGYRLKGEPLRTVSSPADIISAGVTAGTIQVPGDGQPVILMADCQTTGGYSRIAGVISADLPLVAQMLPGNIIRFMEVTVTEAVRIFSSFQKMMNALMAT